MKHQIQRTGGYLKAAITGAETERFITRCAEEGIRMWQVRRKNETTLICYIELTEAGKLKKILKETGSRMRILDKKGVPFLWGSIRSRLGMVAGLFFFLVLLLTLSNMVWDVEVNGADPKLEEQIRSLLKNDHLYVGSLEFFVPATDQLESKLSAKLINVTWIGVSQDGTSYRIDVVQKKYPKKIETAGPRNLVAAKQAVIHNMFVETGQPVVESNQFVKPGQILVLGRIGNENEPKFVSANGKVIGETWYQSETAIPMKSRYTLYTGKSATQHRLVFWGWSLPIWGFKAESFKNYDKEVIRKPLRFLIWELPVSYEQMLYREKQTIMRSLKENEALSEAKETAEKKLLNELPDDSEIVSSTIEDKRMESGKLTVRIHYIVYENIAIPQPIDPAKEQKNMKAK